MRSQTNLQAILSKGHFAVTCEVTPPLGANLDSTRLTASGLLGNVDAVNVNDNPSANVRMSSWAICKILLDSGIEPIMQMTTRDRNRIALQSDLLGASALDIKNVVCMTGDHPVKGDHPQAKKVFDLDSIQWIEAVKRISDEGRLINGNKVEGIPSFFIGCVANPFVESQELHIIKLKKKVRAGAEFIQTQPVFDTKLFKGWLDLAADHGIIDNCHIIAGVIAIKSLGMANYMHNNLPGIAIPDTLIGRLKAVPKEKQREEGIRICIDQIEELKQMKGVKGVHIMAPGPREKISEIIERAGLLPRPQLSKQSIE